MVSYLVFTSLDITQQLSSVDKHWFVSAKQLTLSYSEMANWFVFSCIEKVSLESNCQSHKKIVGTLELPRSNSVLFLMCPLLGRKSGFIFYYIYIEI